MAVKDKVVTLEDLKAAYDDLVEKMGAWEDITSSLTWVDDNLTGYSTYYTYPLGAAGAHGTHNRKKTQISLVKGDKIRVHGFSLIANSDITGDPDTISAVVCDTGGMITFGVNFSSTKYTDNSADSWKHGLAYGTCEFCAPYAGTYTIYDYSGAGNIVVEKQVTT